MSTSPKDFHLAWRVSIHIFAVTGVKTTGLLCLSFYKINVELCQVQYFIFEIFQEFGDTYPDISSPICHLLLCQRIWQSRDQIIIFVLDVVKPVLTNSIQSIVKFQSILNVFNVQNHLKTGNFLSSIIKHILRCHNMNAKFVLKSSNLNKTWTIILSLCIQSVQEIKCVAFAIPNSEPQNT